MQGYVSDELSRFVGRRLADNHARFAQLCQILRDGLLLSNVALGSAWSGNVNVNFDASISNNEMFNPDMVCFCDIPVDQLGLHMRKYSPFGLAFPKSFLADRGASPVHYVARGSVVNRFHGEAFRTAIERVTRDPLNAEVQDATLHPSGWMEDTDRGSYFEEALAQYNQMNDLIRRVLYTATPPTDLAAQLGRFNDLQQFMTFQIFSYLKFWDEALPENHAENFYMEREWRVISSVKFKLDDVCRVVLPHAYGDEFRELFPTYPGNVTLLPHALGDD